MWWRSTGRKLRHISSVTFSIDNYDFTPTSHDAWGVQRPVVANTWWNMTFEHWGQKIKSFCFPFYKRFYLPFCCTLEKKSWGRRLTCFPSIWKVASRTGEGSKRATDLKLKEKRRREKKNKIKWRETRQCWCHIPLETISGSECSTECFQVGAVRTKLHWHLTITP